MSSIKGDKAESVDEEQNNSVDEAQTPLAEVEGVLAAEADGQTGLWQSIETAPKQRKLIVGYANRLGKWRTVLATYYTEGTLESDTNESGFSPEGWYEATEAYEYLMPVEHEPTHWMRLPAPPEVNATADEGDNSR
jgi:hypothetical protein